MAFIDNLFSVLGLSSISSLLSAILSFLLCYIAIRCITKLAGKLLSRSKHLDPLIKGYVQTALKIVLWALAIVIVADALGISTASLVAVIGVAGLALSLSVQNIMSNLFSGITLLITKPFLTGDLIDVGSNNGTVKSVGLFYTVIDTLDNRCISIPNSDVTATPVINYSREPLRRVDMTFETSYDDGTDAVRAAILEAIHSDSKIKTTPAPFIVIGQYKDSSIEYIVRLWCDNSDYWDVYFGMNEHVRESFERNGITMTYNHINVHMVQ